MKLNTVKFFTRTLVVVLSIALNGAVFAEEHDHKKSGEKHAAPDNYSAAVAQIGEHLEHAAKLIESGKLGDVHHEAEGIKKVSESLAKLASKDDSGVAKADVKEINLTAKSMASKADALDEAGDAGKKDETRKVYDELMKLTDTLKKFAKAK